MKRIQLNLFAIILAVSMAFTMAPLSMEKAYADDSITFEDGGVVYTLKNVNNSRTATVSNYTDELPEIVIIPKSVTYEGEDYTVTSVGNYAFVNSGLTSVTFEEESALTNIGNYAFTECKSLTSITIPEEVTSIGTRAFNGCKALETITMPESLTSIGERAFNECESLKSITIPKGVTSIKDGTFFESGLTSVTFAEESKLTSIGESAFFECKSLETITIPESVTSIGECAFFKCENLKDINIPEGAESIGNNAFYGCRSLSTVIIPASVTSMGEYAFHWSGLITVTFEEGSNLTTIEEDAFSDCFSLKTVTIPVSVETIESNAFASAPLETIYYLGSKNQWEAINGAGKPTDATVYYTKVANGVVYTLEYLGPGTYGRATVSGHTDGLPEDVSIPYSVTSDNKDYTVRSIGDNAFKDCESLKTISIPPSVTFIGNGAFDGTSLTTVYFRGTGSQWDAITGDGKPKDNVTVIFASIFIDGIEYGPYNDGTAVVKDHTDQLPAEVEIPPSVSYNGKNYTVTSIAQDAFMTCESLESVRIPASVESIGQGAFYGSGVKTVTIEESSKLKSIGKDVFFDCNSLESVRIPASVESIGQAAFSDCTSLKTVAFEENSKLKSIELSTFDACKSLESVNIPVGVESIGEGAFCGCESLESVSIPASVESIGEGAFKSCTSLKSVSIPASVKSIGESAFYYCTSLSSITIPASATSIHGSAFFRCEALTTFNYLGSKAQWEAIRDTLNEHGKLLVQDGQDIIFKNSDGTELQYSSVKTGLTPQYVGATPTKDMDDQYIYTFAGWDPEITEVTDTATYTAKYDATYIPSKRISLKGAKVALSSASFTYSGKVMKPSVKRVGGRVLTEGTEFTAQWSNAKSKNVGTYSVTVTGQGKYKDTAKATYKINPKGTTLKKPEGAKKAITVNWKKQKAKMSKSRITGYQIQIATNKKFTKNKKTVNVKGYQKTSKIIKKLKSKKKYYVHVRTYMTVKGVKYCSPWSAVKTVKTK